MSEAKPGNGHHADVRRFAQDIRTTLKDSGALLKATARAAKVQAAETVVNRPYASLGVILAVGLLAGFWAGTLLWGGGEETAAED